MQVQRADISVVTGHVLAPPQVMEDFFQGRRDCVIKVLDNLSLNAAAGVPTVFATV